MKHWRISIISILVQSSDHSHLHHPCRIYHATVEDDLFEYASSMLQYLGVVLGVTAIFIFCEEYVKMIHRRKFLSMLSYFGPILHHSFLISGRSEKSRSKRSMQETSPIVLTFWQNIMRHPCLQCL